jgi:type IV pilus assembly protein PilO
MASKSKKSAKKDIDFSAIFSRIGSQFKGVNLNDPSSLRNPSSLPAVPRYILLVVIAAAVVGALWFFWLKDLNNQLADAQKQELDLRQKFIDKVGKANALSLLQAQKKELQVYVDSLEKQLPSKSEMDALLSDINQAGLERKLQFELFKPGSVILKQYYAELPVTLKIIGNYNNIGSFASDVAALSRIVTLNELNLTPGDKKRPEQLTLNAIVRTFRYLDPDEIKAQPKSDRGAK